MNEVKWFCRGETGEKVLDILESLMNACESDDGVLQDVAIADLLDLGLDRSEIMTLLVEENLPTPAWF